MGKRLFWFAIGVGLTALLVVKGRELYERFTPKGVAEQVERTSAQAADWAGECLADYHQAATEREQELREALGLAQ